MFLFTTPNTPQPSASTTTTAGTATAVPATPVTEAIRRGASATGTDFDYLVRTAKRESALDPTAKAPTSSATGLFQFIEQTWLGVVKNDGPSLGLSNAASAIVARGDGTYTVPDAAARQAILKLREEPEAASAMAGALTRRNRESLTAATGRSPSNGELYLAHVLGARGASQLIASAQATPDKPAASDFPDAARANRAIFFARDGKAKSSSEVYAMLTAEKAGGSTASAAAGNEVKLAVTDDRPPGLYGLFQTGARQSPVSDAVSRIWKGQGATRVQPDTKAASFFPRSAALRTTLAEDVASAVSGEEPIVVPAASPAATATLPAEAPLPPARPAFDTDRPIARAIGPIVQLRTR